MQQTTHPFSVAATSGHASEIAASQQMSDQTSGSAWCQSPLGKLRIDANASGILAVTLLEPATVLPGMASAGIVSSGIVSSGTAAHGMAQHGTGDATAPALRSLSLAACPVLPAGPAFALLQLDSSTSNTTQLLTETAGQLDEYFRHQRRQFSLPLARQGTPFQQQVWHYLQQIPYGQVRSYGQQAQALGKASAARAVGAANGRNPVAIIVPCHRVLAADGRLTGYAGGLAHKIWLLQHEARG